MFPQRETMVFHIYLTAKKKAPDVAGSPQLPSGNLTWLWKDPPFLLGRSTIDGHVQ